MIWETTPRTGDINVDINQKARKKIAFYFYKGQGFAEESIPSHLNGIDFSHDVRIETLNRGKKVYQYQSPGAPQGNYYAMHSSVTPSELGIGKMGENRAKGTVELKLKKQYVVNEKTKVIRSTSKEIDDTWSVRGVTQPSSGGGTQLFTTEKHIFVEGVE